MSFFKTDMAMVQWIVVGYMLASGIIMPACGYMMDKFSCKTLFIAGVVVFAASSAVCAVVPTIELMIAARVVQGIAGGILMPVPNTLVYQFIPRERQLMTVSWISMVTTLGIAIGPSLAGIMVKYWGWQAIFWANVPFLLIDLVLILKFVPYKAFGSQQTLDYVGLFAASAATVALLFGFNQGSNLGWTSPMTLALLGGGAVLLAYFVIHAVRMENPLLNFNVFRYRGFTYGFFFNTIQSIATCIGPMFMAIYLQSCMGLDAFYAGLAMVIPSLMMPFMAPLSAKGVQRFSYRAVIMGSMLLLCLATWQMTQFNVHTTLIVFTIWFSMRYIALGLFMPPITNYAMMSVPTRIASHASSMLAWARQFISTVATSMFSLLYAGNILKYMSEGVAAEQGAELQMRIIEGMAVSDVNFASLIVLLVCTPFIMLLKDSLIESGKGE
jgi:EmrB/QacA subfamily drug resistance transporter